MQIRIWKKEEDSDHNFLATSRVLKEEQLIVTLEATELNPDKICCVVNGGWKVKSYRA